ncbi:MAG: thiamine pyrophosphate-binding protein [Chloroflexi bacterium]|nr:thiamine pyrophosphate-binding protein [Chloroflexota bacterium]
MPVLTGAQALVRALEAHGVRFVFGIAGTHNLPIFDALREARVIRTIVARHEQGAAFMADGHARATGRPGVVVTVTGPGVTNTLTALGQSYSDSVPVLHIATQLPTDRVDQECEDFHELRQSLQVTGAVTAWSARARSAAEIPALVSEAFRRFAAERPRPIFLEVPLDLLSVRAEVADPTPIEPRRRAPEDAPIAAAARLLAAARRPLIYAGGGVIASGATRALVDLAELLGAPMLVSANGKGAVPEDHPLFLGGGWGAHAFGREELAVADVVLAVGARFGPLPTAYWRLAIPGTLIHIDLDAREIGKHYPPAVGIVADARLALEALHAAVVEAGRVGPGRPWCDIVAARGRCLEAIRARAGAYLDCLAGLRKILPPEAILFNDLTSVAYWSSAGFPVTQPRTYHYPTGFGCLGHAFPAAIGARLACPDRPVVALAGDGGFLFTGQELATAILYRVPVVCVVFNDHAYGAVKVDQLVHFAGRAFANDLRSPDFVRLAEAYGARGCRVESLSDVPEAVAEALRGDEPAIIEVPVSPVIPPWIT